MLNTAPASRRRALPERWVRVQTRSSPVPGSERKCYACPEMEASHSHPGHVCVCVCPARRDGAECDHVTEPLVLALDLGGGGGEEGDGECG